MISLLSILNQQMVDITTSFKPLQDVIANASSNYGRKVNQHSVISTHATVQSQGDVIIWKIPIGDLLVKLISD